MSHLHPHPAHRMIDHAAQLRLIIKELRHHGVTPDAIRGLRGIAQELCLEARIWEEVYGPGKLPVAVPPLLPYMPKRGLTTLAADEPPIIGRFWEMYEALAATIESPVPEPLNHSSDPELIAIHFPSLYSAWQDSDLPIPDMLSVKRAMKKSVRRPLVERNRLMRSRLLGKTARCWVFER